VRDLPAVDAYITKPFGTRELLAEVRRLLGVRAQE
jgi:DNA-binding response OmpR family regulator